MIGIELYKYQKYAVLGTNLVKIWEFSASSEVRINKIIKNPVNSRSPDINKKYCKS